MKKKNILLLSIAGLWTMAGFAQAAKDSARIARNLTIDEVVVTGTRNETDIRHLPMTISVVNRKVLERRFQPSVLPALTEQVPGLFATSRGIMGYGVSTGAAGGMNLRGIGGSPTAGLLVLIDGHPQYMGLMGHPIADAYQTMLTDQVEVLRGPASVLYGSNAMGGVINIVTRRKTGVRPMRKSATAPTTHCRRKFPTASGKGVSAALSPALTTVPMGIATIWSLSNTAAIPSWDMTSTIPGNCGAM